MNSTFRWAAALLVACSACATSGPAPGGPVTLTVATYPNFDDSLRAALPLWNERHPQIEIKVVSQAFGDHHDAMLSALETGRNVPDVMAVEVGFIGRFAMTHQLEDLSAPPYGGGPLLDQLLPVARPLASSGMRILAAMPADVGPGTLFYRKDLLDRAGITEGDLTRSWESYIEAGKKLKAATGAFLLTDASAIKDIYIRTHLREGEGIFFGPGNEPIVDAPRFQRAFELAREARDAGIDARVDIWTNEWVAGLRRGTIASQPIGAWLAWHMERWLAPKGSGLWRAAQLPGGGFASWGGSFYAIPRRAAHKREAWQFIQFMCLERAAQIAAFRATENWPALLAAQDDPWIDEPIAYLGGQAARRTWKAAAAANPPVPVHMLDPIANDEVNKALQRVLRDGEDIPQALAEAKRELQRRIR